MKKFILKFLMYSLLSVFLLACLAVGGVVLVIQRPDLVLNQKTFAWGAKKASAKGIDVKWGGLEIQAHTPLFFRPEISISFKDLKFAMPAQNKTQSNIHSDFSEATFSLHLDFRKFPPRVTELGPILVKQGNVDFEGAAEPLPSKEDDSNSKAFTFPAELAGAEIKPISIDLENWRFAQGKSLYQGSVRLHEKQEASSTKGQERAEWDLDANEVSYGGVHLAAETPQRELSGPFDVHGYLDTHHPKPARLTIEAHANKDITEISLDLKGRIAKIAPQIPEIGLNDCRFGMSRPDTPAADLTVDCPLEVVAETMKFQQFPQVYFENKVGLRIQGKVSTQDYNDMNKPVHADIRLDLTPFYPLKSSPSAIKSWGGLALSGDAIPAKPVSDWDIHSKVDFNLAIQEFQNIVAILDKTPYAIPAPVRVLHGQIHLTAKGEIDPRGGTLPVVLTTRMQSKDQVFDIDSQGKLVLEFTRPKKVAPSASLPRSLSPSPSFSPISEAAAEPPVKMNLLMDVKLSDLQLSLPHLDVSSFPKLVPDPRMKPEALVGVVKTDNGIFEYKIHINTPDKPIRILTNLASGPIPIKIDLTLDSKAPATLGQINIGEFPVDVFHRKAKIEKFDLTLQEKSMPINGALQVNYTDYTVFVLMKGTTAQPIFQFSSEPALPESECISVLLFGRTSDALDSDQADSAGNVHTAVASKGLDLASMYLLATTPIESVGYDPNSGTFVTKVKLAQGTSLNVEGGGSGGGAVQGVGIQKRLGNNFSITTSVSTLQMDESGTLPSSMAGTSERSVRNARVAASLLILKKGPA